MWVLVTGPSGSSKHVVTDFLKSEDFEVLDDNLASEISTTFNFEKELQLMMSRLRQQIKASSVMSRSNVVTVRSVWDHFEVMIQGIFQLERMSRSQFDSFKIIYDACWDIIPPPNLVIITRTKKQTSFDRSTLRGREIDQDLLTLELSKFDTFYDKLAIPRIEISSDDTPDDIKRSLEFGMASVKASGLYVNTVWEKRIFL